MTALELNNPSSGERFNISFSIDRNVLNNVKSDGLEILLMNKLLTHCFGTLMFSSQESSLEPTSFASVPSQSPSEEIIEPSPNNGVIPRKRKRFREPDSEFVSSNNADFIKPAKTCDSVISQLLSQKGIQEPYVCSDNVEENSQNSLMINNVSVPSPINMSKDIQIKAESSDVATVPFEEITLDNLLTSSDYTNVDGDSAEAKICQISSEDGEINSQTIVPVKLDETGNTSDMAKIANAALAPSVRLDVLKMQDEFVYQTLKGRDRHHCPLCDYGPRSVTSIRVHLICSHSRFYPYHCAKCHKEFKVNSNFRQHARNVHGIEFPF